MGEIFQVTLDELVKGQQPASSISGELPQQYRILNSLYRRGQSLYRAKAHFWGWLLAASGAWYLLQNLQSFLSYRNMMGDASVSESTFLCLYLSKALFAALEIGGGLFVDSWGRRFSGRFRWYHAGWCLTPWDYWGCRMGFLSCDPALWRTFWMAWPSSALWT